MTPKQTQVRSLKCILTREESLQLGKKAAELTFSLAEKEQVFEAIKANHKGEVQGLENDIAKCMRSIREGFELREVECTVYFHEPVAGKKTVRRNDTYEAVEEADMLPHERQQYLFDPKQESAE